MPKSAQKMILEIRDDSSQTGLKFELCNGEELQPPEILFEAVADLLIENAERDGVLKSIGRTASLSRAA